jgi:tetratricopeptide (TPR) repeat protein
MKTRIKTTLLIVGLLSSTCLLGQSSLDKGKVFYEAKKYPEAENIFKSVSEKTADYAAAQYYLGRIAFAKKEYDDAVDYFEKAKELNPNDATNFNWLGDTYATIGKDANLFKQMSVGPKALHAWEKATQLDSKNISARVSLIGAYQQAPAFMGGGVSKSNKMAVEAFPLLDEELKKIPDHHLFLYWYGKSSAMTGLNLDRGEECLQKYLTITPDKGEPSIAGAYMRLGQIKEKKGNKAEAKKNYEIALKMDKTLDQAKEGLERTSK